MFTSIKPWINVPFQIKPFLKRNGAGSKVFGEEIEALCYPVGEVKLVVDSAGAEKTSTTQLYVDGNLAIKVTDDVVFEGATRPIQRISSFYRNGQADIKVVYL